MVRPGFEPKTLGLAVECPNQYTIATLCSKGTDLAISLFALSEAWVRSASSPSPSLAPVLSATVNHSQQTIWPVTRAARLWSAVWLIGCLIYRLATLNDVETRFKKHFIWTETLTTYCSQPCDGWKFTKKHQSQIKWAVEDGETTLLSGAKRLEFTNHQKWLFKVRHRPLTNSIWYTL